MTCVTCHVDQGPEAFRLNARGSGPRKDCRACERTASRDRNRARAAELRDYSRAYGRAHADERRAYRLRRQAEHGRKALTAEQRRRKLDVDNARRRAMTPEQRETRRARWADYFRARSERLYTTDPAYRARIRAASARHRKEHPDAHVANQMRRRARLAAATIEPVSVARVIARDGSTCYLCLRVLSRPEITLDHVVALARGGAHSEANLRVACRSCNSRKGTRLLLEVA